MSDGSTDVANEALQLVGNNMPLVTGVAPTFDDSTAGVALQKLYAPCVATVARLFEWDFARNVATLALTGNAAPLGFSFEYLYPPTTVEIWQLTETTISDPNDPLPTTWSVGNALVSGVQKKVVWTSIANAKAVLNNNPTEDTWDPGFREAVVRLLASELATAIAGRPETAQVYLESFQKFETVAEGRDS